MNTNDLSTRLIVALDVPSGRQALELVAELEGQAIFFKVGLELISSGDGLQVINQLVDRGCQVFADFKMLDIPQTVYRAVKNLNGRGIRFLTVHAEPQNMAAALDAADDVSILAVTVLTSLNDEALRLMGFKMSAAQLVQLRAGQAYEAGCAGVIASPREAPDVRATTAPDFLIVTPGIRGHHESSNDQERTLNVTDALNAGADFVVVGRPIRDAASPRAAASEIQQEIARFEQSFND